MPKRYKDPIQLRLMRWAFPKIEWLSQSWATRLFVQLFFTPLHYGFPEKEREWLKTARKSYLTVEGKKVAVYEWGPDEGAYLLFVHGWAGRGTQFRKFFEAALEKGHRIVTFDGPAHGRSEGKRTNVLEFHTVMTQVLEQFGKPAGVIGHSFGGTVTLYGVMMGLPIDRVTIIGTPVIAELLIQSFLKAVKGSSTTGKAFREHLKKEYGRDFNEFSVEWFLPRINQSLKLQIIHDHYDRDVDVRHAQEAKRLYPSSDLKLTTGLGHTRILKDSTVIEWVLDFMNASV